MICYLVRTELGWEALDQDGIRVGFYGGGLLFACQHFQVRRLMFGAYNRRESWSVEPMHQQEPAD